MCIVTSTPNFTGRLPKQVDLSSLIDSRPKGKKRTIKVQHHYKDHSNDDIAKYQMQEHPARGGVTTPFPLRLHEMLENIQRDAFDHIVSWQPHGRCFVVHKPKDFVELLPRYFKLSKLASFQRQLNLYGFQRLTRGRDQGGYYHELFLKGRVCMAHGIQRTKVKGTGVRGRSNPDQEPDFWPMPWVDGISEPAMPEEEKVSSAIPPLENELFDVALSSMNQYLPVKKNLYVDNTLCSFENKTFHFLDPFQTQNYEIKIIPSVDELLATETEPLDDFSQDFEFPENIGDEIENDEVFCSLLEQIVA